MSRYRRREPDEVIVVKVLADLHVTAGKLLVITEGRLGVPTKVNVMSQENLDKLYMPIDYQVKAKVQGVPEMLKPPPITRGRSIADIPAQAFRVLEALVNVGRVATASEVADKLCERDARSVYACLYKLLALHYVRVVGNATPKAYEPTEPGQLKVAHYSK
jgi:hypothetical protein